MPLYLQRGQEQTTVGYTVVPLEETTVQQKPANCTFNCQMLFESYQKILLTKTMYEFHERNQHSQHYTWEIWKA